jgi:hypothetical protein
MFEGEFEIERAWLGGPFRKVGSGCGKPSKFVCGICQKSTVGVYLCEAPSKQPETALWACSGCAKTRTKATATEVDDSEQRYRKSRNTEVYLEDLNRGIG